MLLSVAVGMGFDVLGVVGNRQECQNGSKNRSFLTKSKRKDLLFSVAQSGVLREFKEIDWIRKTFEGTDIPSFRSTI